MSFTDERAAFSDSTRDVSSSAAFRISALANGADDANAIGSRLDDWCRIFICDTADTHNGNVKTMLTYFVD